MARTPAQQKYFASAKGKLAVSNYRRSDKGKATERKYRLSDKGKATERKYRLSDKGKVTKKICSLRRSIAGRTLMLEACSTYANLMQEFNAINPSYSIETALSEAPAQAVELLEEN